MIINFYDEVKEAWKRQEKCPHTLNVYQAQELVKSYTKAVQAKLAYYLNRWEWDTDILGEYSNYKTAWEYALIFNAFVSKYNIFKFECKEIKKMSDEEFKEAVIARLFDSTF